MTMHDIVLNIAGLDVVVQGVLRLAPPTRPSDERPPVMYGHLCLVLRVSVLDRYYSNPASIGKYSVSLFCVTTCVLLYLYMSCTILTYSSGMPFLLKHHQIRSLNMLSNAFSRSTQIYVLFSTLLLWLQQSRLALLLTFLVWSQTGYLWYLLFLSVELQWFVPIVSWSDWSVWFPCTR